jgi:SulP family sulfate permease
MNAGTAIHLAPFLPTLRGYSRATLRRDLQSGITVAVFAVPQVTAYALLAGVPAAQGLYAALVMSLVAALWGSSSFLNTGPSNSAALLTATALLPFAGHPEFMRILFLFTLLVGAIRMSIGLLRLGQLLDFVPESAFLGFTFGAGILIALGQLHHLLGVSASTAGNFVARVAEVLAQAGQTNFFTLGIGVGCLVIMLGMNRYAGRYPVALVTILLATTIAAVIPESAGVRLVRDITPVPAGLPGFALPLAQLDIAWQLLPGAAAVAMIGLIEAISIGQVLALKHGQPLAYNQELFGQGLSHVVSAFFQGMPGSGSFGRSMLIEQTGGVTRLANVFFSVAMGLALVFCTGLLNLIPICALSGLLLFVGIRLIDIARARRVWATSRPDAAVLLVTLITTVFIKIEYGIFAGIVAAALFFLNRARRLRLYELLPDLANDRFQETLYETGSHHEACDVVAVGLGGDLYYGSAREFRQRLQSIIAQQKPRFLILRIRRAYSMDFSCWSALFDVAEVFHNNGGRLYLCGVRPDVDEVIDQARMRDVIPKSHIFTQDKAIFQAFHACLAATSTQLGATPTLSNRWREYFRPTDTTSRPRFVPLDESPDG